MVKLPQAQSFHPQFLGQQKLGFFRAGLRPNPDDRIIMYAILGTLWLQSSIEILGYFIVITYFWSYGHFRSYGSVV